jgi:hypothetical protein
MNLNPTLFNFAVAAALVAGVGAYLRFGVGLEWLMAAFASLASVVLLTALVFGIVYAGGIF